MRPVVNFFSRLGIFTHLYIAPECCKRISWPRVPISSALYIVSVLLGLYLLLYFIKLIDVMRLFLHGNV